MSCIKQERKKNQVPRSYLLQDLRFFCPTSRSSQESEGFFCQQATYKGSRSTGSQGSRWVCQGWSVAAKGEREKEKKRKEKDQGRWSVATRRGREKKKKRKEKDHGRWEGGYSKGKVLCALHQEFLFLVHEDLGLEAARLGRSVSSYKTWSARKPCAKEVPETDYLTQQKQYLKRTTLCTY